MAPNENPDEPPSPPAVFVLVFVAPKLSGAAVAVVAAPKLTPPVEAVPDDAPKDPNAGAELAAGVEVAPKLKLGVAVPTVGFCCWLLGVPKLKLIFSFSFFLFFS